jgi:HEPN domain-containing protein
MQQALYDLQAANLSLNNNFHEWAAYQAEQAAEKALKAVVVHAGWRPPKMHRLGILFGMCNQANARFRESKFSFKHLESFTFIARYPFLIPGKNKAPHDLIAHKDAAIAMSEATEIVNRIKDILAVTPCTKVGELQMEKMFTVAEVKNRIEEIKSILIREFNPEEIVLFGRFAREMNHPVSGTMDILIVAESHDSFMERIVKAREATRGGTIIIEPLIYTPAEFELMTKDEGEGFIESALEEVVVLYKKAEA